MGGDECEKGGGLGAGQEAGMEEYGGRQHSAMPDRSVARNSRVAEGAGSEDGIGRWHDCRRGVAAANFCRIGRRDGATA